MSWAETRSSSTSPIESSAYALAIEKAVVVEWDLPASRMRVHRWTAGRGLTVSERTYP
ncbi:MAG TPA: hypothetical protein VFL58_07560 [Gaiellaceae bacterium]|nr:hypothetical protein [Gaiellaceae bacterium]